MSGRARAGQVLICLSAVGLAGCATLTRGPNATFTVETTPSGAAVQTTNGFSCEATPCTFRIPRRSEFAVTITKDGYRTWQGQVTNRVAGGGGAAMAGNVLVGGLIGAGIDAGSGAMLDLVPNPLTVTLEATTVAPATEAAPAPTPVPVPTPAPVPETAVPVS